MFIKRISRQVFREFRGIKKLMSEIEIINPLMSLIVLVFKD